MSVCCQSHFRLIVKLISCGESFLSQVCPSDGRIHGNKQEQGSMITGATEMGWRVLSIILCSQNNIGRLCSKNKPQCLPYNHWYIKEILPSSHFTEKAGAYRNFLVWFSVVWGVGFDPFMYLLYGIKNIFRYFICSVQLFWFIIATLCVSSVWNKAVKSSRVFHFEMSDSICCNVIIEYEILLQLWFVYVELNSSQGSSWRMWMVLTYNLIFRY